MLLKRITKISQIFGLSAAILGAGAFSYTNAATSVSTILAFVDDDQDKGKGKGRGKGGDQGGGRDHGDRGRDPQRDSDKQARRQQKDSDKESRRQQRSSDDDSWRQQQRSDQNSRRQQWESDRESRRQQQQSDQNSRRQQWESERNARRQQAENEWNSRQQQIANQRDRYRDDRRRSDDRRIVYPAPGVFRGQIFNGSPLYRVDNRPFDRDLKRALKDERKAHKQYQKDARRYDRNGYGSYSAPVYGYQDNYYGDQSAYNGGSSWKAQILPMLIANIFGGGGGFDTRGGGLPVQRYYGDSSNVSSYDDRYRQPAYSYEPSYGAPYNNDGYNYPGAYDQQGFNAGNLLSSLPIAEIIEQYTGENEFISGLIGSFLMQGYDQGQLAGQFARQNGYGDEQYNDPYAYQNGAYDPYSASLGENRRYLSEGYEQGYRDALQGNQNFDQGNAGASDLVSVLLNSVLSGV